MQCSDLVVKMKKKNPIDYAIAADITVFLFPHVLYILLTGNVATAIVTVILHNMPLNFALKPVGSSSCVLRGLQGLQRAERQSRDVDG